MATTFKISLGNDVPSYRFAVTLSGIIFVLRLRYNTRMTRWFLDIADSANNDILLGLPILLLRDLTGQYTAVANVPQGALFCDDLTNQGTNPTRYSFGTTHGFFYLDPTQ